MKVKFSIHDQKITGFIDNMWEAKQCSKSKRLKKEGQEAGGPMVD